MNVFYCKVTKLEDPFFSFFDSHPFRSREQWPLRSRGGAAEAAKDVVWKIFHGALHMNHPSALPLPFVRETMLLFVLLFTQWRQLDLITPVVRRGECVECVLQSWTCAPGWAANMHLGSTARVCEGKENGQEKEREGGSVRARACVVCGVWHHQP